MTRPAVGTLPPDHHVHSEWSWDAPAGDMLRTCERAVAIGLPSVAFTEHVDHTVWRVELDVLAPDDHLARLAGDDGMLNPPPLDVGGYLAALEECRHRFPELRILSGVELGEPHRHRSEARLLLAGGDFDRVLGSVHSLRSPDGGFTEPPGLFATTPPVRVVEDYLAEVGRLVASSLDFEVLAHVDYPLRSWPGDAPPYELRSFEDHLREILRALARSGRALELNTRMTPRRELLDWWRDAGGDAVSFGSDAHRPDDLAREFEEARRVAEACGFRPGRRPHDLWRRA